jgi:hypothetical protein
LRSEEPMNPPITTPATAPTMPPRQPPPIVFTGSSAMIDCQIQWCSAAQVHVRQPVTADCVPHSWVILSFRCRVCKIRRAAGQFPRTATSTACQPRAIRPIIKKQVCHLLNTKFGRRAHFDL